MRTQALVNTAVDAPFVLTDIELGEPQENEVLVEIVACGLCHTELVMQAGQIPTEWPSILGHEGSGTVVKAGSGVEHKYQPGDVVLLSFASCQSCASCSSSRPAGCSSWVEHNFGRRRAKDEPVATTCHDGTPLKGTFFGQSSLARHALVQASSCVKIAKDTPRDTLALYSPLGCGLQTGAGAVINVLRPRREDSIVVFGLGAVGFAAVFAASYLGVSTIIAVDLVPSRLALALETGAHHTIDGSRADVVEQIQKLTDGGATYAIEATGVVPVLRNAWASLAYAGTVVSLGNPGPGIRPPFDVHDMVNTGKAWRGCVEGDSNPPQFIPFLIELYKQGKFPIDRLSKLYPVEEWDAAVSAMKSGEVIKPIITFK
ncbi:NAD(P)-dependent alcohol dehydrogenase [Sporobolomyces koalae]|uniref:NAD(P)-dependent alcohol dehydrogenase n=1 Tax=Sporobolomyces koalae TaxID=500713 RepID=UPI003172C433